MPLGARLLEDARLLRIYARKRGVGIDFARLFTDIAEYDHLLRRYVGKPLSDSRAFEIGYGARPYRLRALQSLGVDVYGVDAEAPVLVGSIAEYRRMLACNGWERSIKTLVRRALYERREQAAFRSELAKRKLRTAPIEPHRFLVHDAADCDPPKPFDLIYSRAVFEHIDRSSLSRLVPRMVEWLAPGGIAVIVPDIFTGPHGGHILDPRAEPWEHLRKRRFPANTTLNEMTRAEYVALFERHFEILEVIESERGSVTLTAEIRAELRSYSEQELLDENPVFVLRPR
jgi:Methyltransferase domain